MKSTHDIDNYQSKLVQALAGAQRCTRESKTIAFAPPTTFCLASILCQLLTSFGNWWQVRPLDPCCTQPQSAGRCVSICPIPYYIFYIFYMSLLTSSICSLSGRQHSWHAEGVMLESEEWLYMVLAVVHVAPIVRHQRSQLYCTCHTW